MATLRYAIVRFKGKRAGRLLEIPEGGTAFEYADDFGDSIACALPRKTSRHEWPDGLHPFFEHLTAEGALRARQTRLGDIDRQDDFGLLLRYGAECIGAVSVHDPETPDLGSTDTRELDPRTEAALVSRSISGVQDKLLVRREGNQWAPAGDGEIATHIAKFAPEDGELDTIVRNEDLSLSLAGILLGRNQVAEAAQGIVTRVERPALIVTRFDRTQANDALRCEDFAQVLSKPRGRDFGGKYDAEFSDLQRVLARWSARPAIDELRLLERIIAYALLGNCDCHLKNFSLIETPEGLRLAPAYDVVNTYIYGRYGYDTRFGLKLDGERLPWDRIDRYAIKSLGEQLAQKPKNVDRTVAKLCATTDRVIAAIANERDDEWLEDYRQGLLASIERICG